MTKVFAFEWCGCIYESGFSIHSLHTTKRGAFKEMVRVANSRWRAERDTQIMYGYTRRHSPLTHEAWRLTTYEIKD